jgi:hypothetical protein
MSTGWYSDAVSVLETVVSQGFNHNEAAILGVERKE